MTAIVGGRKVESGELRAPLEFLSTVWTIEGWSELDEQFMEFKIKIKQDFALERLHDRIEQVLCELRDDGTIEFMEDGNANPSR